MCIYNMSVFVLCCIGNSMMVAGYTTYNMMFSTSDKDNDKSSTSCALRYTSGWWFNACFTSNLNGAYLKVSDVVFPGGSGINWLTITGNHKSLKSTTMMIKQK